MSIHLGGISILHNLYWKYGSDRIYHLSFFFSFLSFRVLTLQAENEYEMYDWITSLQNAIARALNLETDTSLAGYPSIVILYFIFA